MQKFPEHETRWSLSYSRQLCFNIGALYTDTDSVAARSPRSFSSIRAIHLHGKNYVPRLTGVWNDDSGPRHGRRRIENGMWRSCCFDTVRCKCMHISCIRHGNARESIRWVNLYSTSIYQGPKKNPPRQIIKKYFIRFTKMLSKYKVN